VTSIIYDASKLINDILDYSKIEAGKVELEKHSFNLYELVSKIDTLFKSSEHNKELIMGIMIGENVPHYLLGDSFRLRQILSNLIGML
jgi:signal transduction histidine kinase